MVRIGIVEDNQVIRESLMAYIQTDPELQCVCTAANAAEALQTLPRHKPDIVLMDIQLPDISGIECTAKLKPLLPNVRVMMVTVYGDPDLIFKALRAGASGYLLKSCSPAELVSAVREVNEGGAPMSRDIARKVIAFFQEPLPVVPGSAAEFQDLSPREREILELLAKGMRNKKIAQTLGMADGTVRWHLRHVYNKLHVRSRTEAILKFRSGTEPVPGPEPSS
jgi:DNA-binding NarL/FixJ family response regulator